MKPKPAKAVLLQPAPVTSLGPYPFQLQLQAPVSLPPGLPEGPQVLQLQVPAPAGLPSAPGSHTLQKGSAYTRPIIRDQERLLVHLIPINKHRDRQNGQRNVFQMKNPDKTPEKELNATETKHSKEFKTLVVRTLNELRRRIDELSEKFNQDRNHKREPSRNEKYNN